MTPETPARGVLKVNEWGSSKMYKIDCSCGNNDCAHVLDIEADESDVTVTVYATAKTPYWRLSRFSQIWQLLTKGYLEYQTTICMDKQVALNYANVLQSAVKDVEEFRKENVKNKSS